MIEVRLAQTFNINKFRTKYKVTAVNTRKVKDDSMKLYHFYLIDENFLTIAARNFDNTLDIDLDTGKVSLSFYHDGDFWLIQLLTKLINQGFLVYKE